MATVLDTTRNCSTIVDCLKLQGYTTVIRYYCRADITWKRLFPEEAVALGRAGMNIAAVYQNRQNQAADFSQTKGRNAGRDAYSYAHNSIFQPSGSAIYFAVDFDASKSIIEDNVIPFFIGVREAFEEIAADETEDVAYKIGVYGSGRTCRMLREAGHVDYAWLAQATGWGEFTRFSNSRQWNLKQSMPATVCGISCDPDETNPDHPEFGAFLLDPEVLGPAAPGPVATPGDDRYTVIASGGLRVRSGPGSDFEVLGLLGFGTIVRVMARHGDWAMVDASGDGGADGFVHASFLRKA
jgi:hypothetical protein